MKHKTTLLIISLLTLQYLTACSLSIGNFSENINRAVKANNDPQTVMQGLPTYLILLDGIIESDPLDEDVLIASSRLINAYTGLLGSELEMLGEDENEYQREKIKQQIKKLSLKALERALKANCLYEEYLCDLNTIKYAEFKIRLKNIDEDDIAMLYSLGTAWATWLQANSSDWNAMAQLPQVKLIMETVNGINENWDNAGAHMYLGVLNSLLPTNLGGKPEQGKKNFESAIKLTQGKNLMAKVLYAEYYARLTFNEDLHQRLISDVLSYKEQHHEFVLLNTLAIQKAKALQLSAEEYF